MEPREGLPGLHTPRNEYRIPEAGPFPPLKEEGLKAIEKTMRKELEQWLKFLLMFVEKFVVHTGI